MAAEIYLVRHGETEWNRLGRWQGKLDSPLTLEGREQARVLGKILKRELGSRSVSLQVSPLGRTRSTAAIAAEGLHSGRMAIEPRLREISLGSWDGLSLDEIRAENAGLLEGSTPADWFFRAPDGDSYKDSLARAAAWLAEQTGTVVAVSHGMFGRFIRSAYLGLNTDETLALTVPQDVVWRLAEGRMEKLS